MKTQNSNLSLFAVMAFTAVSGLSRAADLIVEENGVAPNFATIQAAVTAATSGDRIFVKNKAGNVPYTENVSIDKPLELLSYDPDGVYYVFGGYTVVPSSGGFSLPGGTVRVIGMYNNSGGIAATTNNTTGSVIHLALVNCSFVSGSVNFSGTGFNSHVAGNNLQSGSITTREATISGNQVNGSITINDAGTVAAGDDTLYIVGNRLATAAGGATAGSIQWNNPAHYFHIANNVVRSNAADLVLISAFKIGALPNQVLNNSCETPSNALNTGVKVAVSVPAGARLIIANNALNDEFTGDDTGTTENAIDFTAGVTPGAIVEVNYNVHKGWEAGLSNGSTAAISFVGNALGGAGFNPNDITGACADASCVNLGQPSTDYTDHDLTRNDVETAGGSFNYNNFWPNQSGGARVYLVKTPRTVVQSSTINAKADSYDR